MKMPLIALALCACSVVSPPIKTAEHSNILRPVVTEEIFAPEDGAPVTQPAPATSPTKVTEQDLIDLKAMKLLLPVKDINVDSLSNSYSAKRSGGRVHHAIDIMAPKQTPVLATIDGKIVKLHKNKLGGITIYQTDPDGKFLFYYAHLDHYETGLEEGQEVKQGDVIGYVGNTGNAKGKSPHLHFSISKVVDPSKWWKGLSINPYPILTAQE